MSLYFQMQSFTRWEQELKTWLRESTTKVMGKNAIFFAEIDSTNKYLKEQSQLKHGTLVIAQQQRQGKGQKNRQWISNPGGLYMSIKLEIQSTQNFQPFWLTAMFSLGLCKALTQLGLSPTIKWPNDVLVNNKKIAGILTETIITQGSLTAIVGLGCNVNNSLDTISKSFPDLSSKISSVKLETGSDSPILYKDILEPTLNYVESQMDEFSLPRISRIKADWSEFCQIENKTVEIQRVNSDEIFLGFVTKVTDSGSLLIKLENNSIEEFTAGEIKLKR